MTVAREGDRYNFEELRLSSDDLIVSCNPAWGFFLVSCGYLVVFLVFHHKQITPQLHGCMYASSESIYSQLTASPE